MTDIIASGSNDIKPVIRKRKSISFIVKLDMIMRSERGETLSQIARLYGLNRSTISGVLKDKLRILEHVKNSAPLHSTIISKKRKSIIVEMERLLITWLEDLQRRNVPISLKLIQEKARGIHEDLKKLSDYSGDEEQFVASRGWFNRFKERANLHNIEGWEDVKCAKKLHVFQNLDTIDPLALVETTSDPHYSNNEEMPMDKPFPTEVKKIKEESELNEDCVTKQEENFSNALRNSTPITNDNSINNIEADINRNLGETIQGNYMDISIVTPATTEKMRIKKEYYNKKLMLMARQTTMLEIISEKLCQLVDK